MNGCARLGNERTERWRWVVARVEVGQLAFVAAVLAFVALIRRIPLRVPTLGRAGSADAIGLLAIFWLVERIADF